MDFIETIQIATTLSIVLLGLIYLIGGLIVNLNLTRRGVVEYQIVKVKYLAVGVIFIFQFLGVIIFTFIPVVLISLITTDPQVIRILSIPSILAALALLFVWSRYPPNTTSFLGTWPFWFILSVLATIYPLYVMVYQAIASRFSFDWVFNMILAVMVGILTIMAQIYHYSAFYYGRPARMGALDPIGMGIPTRVSLVCDKDISLNLKNLGLPVQANIVRDIYLVDETNEHYIVSQVQVPGGDGNNKTYKINKALVKVILHHPDHMRKLSGDRILERKKPG